MGAANAVSYGGSCGRQAAAASAGKAGGGGKRREEGGAGDGEEGSAAGGLRVGRCKQARRGACMYARSERDGGGGRCLPRAVANSSALSARASTARLARTIGVRPLLPLAAAAEPGRKPPAALCGCGRGVCVWGGGMRRGGSRTRTRHCAELQTSTRWLDKPAPTLPFISIQACPLVRAPAHPSLACCFCCLLLLLRRRTQAAAPARPLLHEPRGPPAAAAAASQCPSASCSREEARNRPELGTQRMGSHLPGHAPQAPHALITYMHKYMHLGHISHGGPAWSITPLYVPPATNQPTNQPTDQPTT